jgi:hypothetical protein
VQGIHIQQAKLEAVKGEGMGDHGDLPICRKFLQLRRLHGDSQPREKLDKVIEEIQEMMIRSSWTTSKEQLSRK